MKIYLVKFDKGYYAQKQPTYEWCYTDNPQEALRYKTFKAAKEKANHGLELNSNSNKIVVIEEFELVETLTYINKQYQKESK